jgi:ketosteroid isomerase-like protein
MGDPAQEVERAATRWMQAWLTLDRAMLEDSLAKDFTLTVSAFPTRPMTRQAWLDTCDRYRCSRFAYRDVQVRAIADGIAVMSSIADQEATLDGHDRSGAFWLTDLWRREEDGAWRVFARFSGYPEPDRASANALAALPNT